MQHLTATDFETLRAGNAVPPAVARHLDGCLSCRRAYGGPVAAPDSRKARPWMLGAAAALVAAAVFLTPLRSVAGSFLEVFEPHTVGFVPITLNDMQQLGRMPDLAMYGTSRTLVNSMHRSVSDPRDASLLARFAVRVPSLGIDRSKAPTFDVTSPSAQQFAFSAARARAAAAARHAALAPMPPGLDGSTLEVELGSTVLATYGSTARPTAAFAHQTNPDTRRSNGYATTADAGFAPVVVAQMRAPKIYSTGVSAAVLENYLISQPGFPPHLAAAFRALGDPSTTLPIPIPVDKAYAQPVLVDGVRGVGIGDDTGLGAAVVWQERGILYAVCAPLPARDVLAIADSLR